MTETSTPPPAAPVAPVVPSGLLKGLSIRDIVIILGLVGGFGTATGAGGANLFAPDNTRLEAIEKISQENGKQIQALLNAQMEHGAAGGHIRTEARLDVLEREFKAQNERTRAFWSDRWPQLTDRISGLESKLLILIERKR